MPVYHCFRQSRKNVCVVSSLGVLALAMSVLPGNAAAAFLSFNYTASGNGGSVVGTLSYDTNAPDRFPDRTDLGGYEGTTLTGAITGGPQDGGAFNLSLTTNVSVASFGTTLYQLGSGTYLFLDGPGQIFPSATLPNSIDLSQFTYASKLLVGNDALAGQPYGQIGQYTYNLTSITPAAVPLPATSWLMFTALAGFISIKARKTTKK